MVNMEQAVVHHTESPDWSVERIRQIHVEERGWQDIGYHYVIRANGRIEVGRPTTLNGAHARGRNHLLGIALTGRDVFTSAQVDALKELCRVLNVRKLERHHEQCPGVGLDVEGIL